MIEEMFKKRNVAFNAPARTMKRIQFLRSLYLLTGHDINHIPNTTEMIDGALLFFYVKLNEEMKSELNTEKKLLKSVIDELPFMMVENELDEDEYNEFVRSVIVPENENPVDDNKQNNDYPKAEISEMKQQEDFYSKDFAIQGSLDTKGRGMELIHIIIKEEQLEIVKGINVLFNKIRDTRNMYSISDVIREVIDTVFNDDEFSSLFMFETFVGNLYEIPPLEYLKFNHKEKINLNLHVDFKKFRFILADMPLVKKSLSMITPYREKKVAIKNFNDFLASSDLLRSYVSDFDYSTASQGYAVLFFALKSGMNLPNLIYSSITGTFQNQWNKLSSDIEKSIIFNRVHVLIYMVDSLMWKIGKNLKK